MVASHALALRRTALDLILPLEATRHADWWAALLMAGSGGIASTTQVLVDYRLHSGSAVGIAGDATFAERRAGTERARHAQKADVIELALARLHSKAPGYLCSDAEAELLELVRHLRTRATMNDPLLSRLVTVTKEMVAGNYRRFGNGWRSALNDLFVETTGPDRPTSTSLTASTSSTRLPR